MLFKVVLTVELEDKILKCGHSTESYCSLLYFPVVVFIMLCMFEAAFTLAPKHVYSKHVKMKHVFLNMLVIALFT